MTLSTSFPLLGSLALCQNNTPMPDVEVHIELAGRSQRVGLLRINIARQTETFTFEYDSAWIKDSNSFSIGPALSLTPGSFPPPKNRTIFGSLGDSAPDNWGRRLMQRAERRRAKLEGRRVLDETVAFSSG